MTDRKTTEENHLSFIETSALDATNVELAFQNILTGNAFPSPQLLRRELATNTLSLIRNLQDRFYQELRQWPQRVYRGPTQPCWPEHHAQPDGKRPPGEVWLLLGGA